MATKIDICAAQGHQAIPVMVSSSHEQTAQGSNQKQVTAMVCTHCGKEIGRIR